MIPIARWKGYAGEARINSSTFESITWACGLLAATRRINVFCTVHVSLFHPLIAAKQMATADHIGQGRLVLNLVCGAIEDEFQMFGVPDAGARRPVRPGRGVVEHRPADLGRRRAVRLRRHATTSFAASRAHLGRTAGRRRW